MIEGIIFDACSDPIFWDFLIDENFESILDIEPPCGKKEYEDFIKHKIEPTTCSPFKIYQFQAEVLKLIFESPRILERIKIEYGIVKI